MARMTLYFRAQIARRLLWLLALGMGALACTQPMAGAPVAHSASVTATNLPISAPVGRPQAAVLVSETQITLPTYPFERYQTEAFDLVYRWPYKRFDVERFRAEAPTPSPRRYEVVVLENEYLQLLVLPALGGRLWQVIHKPTGALMFYQNPVVKPTHWGQPKQLGWLALGGLEWGLPVIEHGYDWGVPWPYQVETTDDGAAITLTTPDDGRLIQASIRIALQAGEASFTVTPSLHNVGQQGLAFSFWINAALAPGSGRKPSGQLHFVLPTDQVQLHSTGDADLPLPARTFSWPVQGKRDFSRLGSWRQYLGFFESPAAHGPFVGVYDPAYDAGAVRTFPPEIARGSKVFALGWRDALGSDNFTADDSAYVELHGGLAPSFFDQAHLSAGETLTWQERWYPVAGIGDLVYANAAAALNVVKTGGGLRVALYPTQPLQGTLHIADQRGAVRRLPIAATPDAPYLALVDMETRTESPLTLWITDSAGVELLRYAEAES
jgi:hypothetical protein